jgi:hypothetical protein
MRSVLGMPKKRIAPGLADRLCSLAESQLQTQAARSASVDAGALGVVSACVAIAALVLSTRSAHHFWIATLVLLGSSAGLAVRALLLRGARAIGPLVVDVLDTHDTDNDEDVQDALLKDLAAETLANQRALDQKDPLIAWALAFLVLAVLFELAGVVQ